ncbi:hypothetical protein HYZ98_03715 [Candidatus Peregrinibacteria bacterium]|nr:hypothetical protein [Candidatus Peregrinibacteria bacterium]
MKRATFLTTVLVIILVALVVVLDTRRRQVEGQLKDLSVQMDQLAPQRQQNEQLVKQILVKVKRHMALPGDAEPTVATIVDVEALRAQNSFYQSAENGDHLIVTPTRAILYDPDKDIILDVVPVQLKPASPPSTP